MNFFLLYFPLNERYPKGLRAATKTWSRPQP
jgi:hypothetical protein